MLSARGVGKRYGAVQALSGVDAEFRPGEIHAVLGENGAGKSTFVGVLSGFVLPDAGVCELDGVPVPLGRPFECRKLGIGMVHQHFTLVPAFSVEENLALARLQRLNRPLSANAEAAAPLAIGESLGWRSEPGARTGALSVGEQQRLEILKALDGDSKAVLFDEPTAALSPDEVEELFRVLRSLKERGKIVVLIAHKLSEVLAVADRVTVLRRSKVVASAAIDEVDEAKLATWMVGELPAGLSKPGTVQGEEIVKARGLEVRGDRGELAIQHVTFSVRRGEILGIGGVDGNGQVELAEAIAGVRGFRGALEIQSDRTGYIPQDRQRDGLALEMSVEENLLLARPDLFRLPRLARLKKLAALAAEFDIRTSSLGQSAGSLSGGNQQKIILARVLDGAPGCIVAHNPSRGLDLRATDFVHRRLLAERSRGAAILLISSDLDELAALADRTVFLSSGRLVEAVSSGSLVGGSKD